MITSDTLRKYAPMIKYPDIHADALEAEQSASSVTAPRRFLPLHGSDIR